MVQLIDTTDMSDAGYKFVSAKMNADSLTDSAWQGATWALVVGRAVNTPAFSGGELIINGNMEIGDPPNNWNVNGASTLSSAADERTGGAGIASINCVRGTNNVVSIQPISIVTLPQYSWFKIDGWIKNISGVVCQIDVSSLVVGSNPSSYSGLVWEEKYSTGIRTTSAGGGIWLVVSNAAGNTARFDDVSLKKLSTQTLPRIIPFSTQYFATCKAGWTVGTGLQAGVIANLDSLSTPANFVLAIHNRTNAQLWKCVAGTYTKLVDEAATYGADRLVEIRRPSGNTYQLYYHGSQVGTDQTISDAGIIDNKLHGLFSTGDGNSAANFTFTGA